MAYQPTIWTNREVEKPRTYTSVDNGDGTITLTPAEGLIISAGTPIVAENLNNIEDWITNADPNITSYGTRLTTAENNINKKPSVYIDTVGGLIMQRASSAIYGTSYSNANFLVAVQDMGHSFRFVIGLVHWQYNEILSWTTMKLSVPPDELSVATNTIGTIDITGLAGTPRYTIQGLSGLTVNGVI